MFRPKIDSSLYQERGGGETQTWVTITAVEGVPVRDLPTEGLSNYTYISDREMVAQFDLTRLGEWAINSSVFSIRKTVVVQGSD